jgi:hypothetical protein
MLVSVGLYVGPGGGGGGGFGGGGVKDLKIFNLLSGGREISHYYNFDIVFNFGMNKVILTTNY